MQEEFEDKFAKQAKENARLVAKEISAKEASRLKSQVLDVNALYFFIVLGQCEL